MRVTDKYVFFWGSEFSQWYTREFQVDDMVFVTAEQYMMYSKAMTMGDEVIAKQILASHDPNHQKQLGRAVKNFDPQKWDAVKEDVVYRANLAKFSQNADLKELLTVTYGDKIFVEASPSDTIWGIGLHETDSRVLNEAEWKGQNLLGVALNRVQQTLLKK